MGRLKPTRQGLPRNDEGRKPNDEGMTKSETPTSNFQLPTPNSQLPTSNFQLPTSNSHLRSPSSHLPPGPLFCLANRGRFARIGIVGRCIFSKPHSRRVAMSRKQKSGPPIKRFEHEGQGRFLSHPAARDAPAVGNGGPAAPEVVSCQGSGVSDALTRRGESEIGGRSGGQMMVLRTFLPLVMFQPIAGCRSYPGPARWAQAGVRAAGEKYTKAMVQHANSGSLSTLRSTRPHRRLPQRDCHRAKYRELPRGR